MSKGAPPSLCMRRGGGTELDTTLRMVLGRRHERREGRQAPVPASLRKGIMDNRRATQLKMKSEQERLDRKVVWLQSPTTAISTTASALSGEKAALRITAGPNVSPGANRIAEVAPYPSQEPRVAPALSSPGQPPSRSLQVAAFTDSENGAVTVSGHACGPSRPLIGKR
jgi:hypothetical protein